MWSGDMQSGYPTQWALNPSAYQNLSNDQVDWASLAQQWIKMKETFPADQVPPAPPPPPIKLGDLHDVEGGEAPMDMSKDDTVPPESSNWSSWDNWQQWGWNWSGTSPTPASPVPSGSANKVAAMPSVPPYTYTQPNSTPNFPPETSNSFDYNHGSTIPDQFNQQSYWSEPAPFIRGNKSSEWKGDRHSGRHKSVKSDEEEDSTAIIDAAKRKQLPAWIREGLEKMEREKQKKIERERMLKEREEELSRRKIEEVSQEMDSEIPPKSKFDSDSEESEKESEEASIKPKRSRFQDSESPSHNEESRSKASPSPPPPPQRSRTKEQILQDVMHKVRNILTEILMTVTNDEMRGIVDETLANYRAKAPAMQLRKTPALTSLTGKLGLGIYDSESDETEDDSDEEPAPIQENKDVSDQELKERIAKRKQEFIRIEQEIESRIKEQEERERGQLLQEIENVNETEEVEPEDEPQVEPNHNSYGVKLELQEKELVNEESQSETTRDVDYQISERSNKSFRESSEEQTESSSSDSSESSPDSYSRSRSRSSSDSRHKKSHESFRRRKEKTVSRSKRKRSLSRGSDRRKSRRKSSYDRRRNDRRRVDRSRSRDNKRYSDYSNSTSRRRRSPSYRSPSYHHSPNRHRSSSRHRSPSHFSNLSYSSARKRRHRSYSSSPEVSRGKRSSHRSRD